MYRSRKAISEKKNTDAKIGPFKTFALFTAQNSKPFLHLPFNERMTALAVAYAELPQEAFASVRAEAQKNAVLRPAGRKKVKAPRHYSPFGLLASENKALFKGVPLKEAMGAVYKKYKALSASEKAVLMEKANDKNGHVKDAQAIAPRRMIGF